MDVLGALIGILVTSPFLFVAAVAVKVDSPGPVLFRQVRVGQDGRHFQIMKFRSMRVQDGPLVTAGGDPRITRSGIWLRSTKLDELPQFLNVLIGDMSLVGPRPETPNYVELWPEPARNTILSVRPGITDPASIVFRRESELLATSDDPERLYVEEIIPRKVELYCDYVRSRSIWGDLRLIVRTIKAVVGR